MCHEMKEAENHCPRESTNSGSHIRQGIPPATQQLWQVLRMLRAAVSFD